MNKGYVMDEPQSIVGMTIAEVHQDGDTIFLHMTDNKSIVIISPILYRGYPGINMALGTVNPNALQ